MKTILITGQTDLLTTSILEEISGRFSLVLTTQDQNREEDEGRVYAVKPATKAFNQLFWAYDFSAVWYFTPCCDGGKAEESFSEMKAIREQCLENGVKKLLVVSSAALSKEEKEAEERAAFLGSQDLTQTVLVRVPGILVEGNEKNSLGRIFSSLYHHAGTIEVSGDENGNYEYLEMRELIELLRRMTLSARDSGVYCLPGNYTISKDELAQEISRLGRNSHLLLSGRKTEAGDSKSSGLLWEKYSYAIKEQKPLPFRELYEEYAEAEKARSGGLAAFMTKIRGRIPRGAVKLIDLVVLFFLAEYISHFTSDFVYFHEIDVRLIYIFLMATFHGLRTGVIAAVAECVVLFFQYRMMGIYGFQLFYNVENWIPFVLCIVTGAVTGYFSDLRENEKKLINRENALLREKYLFLNDMYHVSSEVRDQYRKQILTFDQSYGKVCHALEQMRADTVSEVCMRAQGVLEQMLDNPSIRIYYCRSGSERFVQAVSPVSGTGGDYEYQPPKMSREMFDVLNRGEIFCNTQMKTGLPFYAISLRPKVAGHEEISYEPLLIAAWDAVPEQMNDYYANQFEILCRLTGQALDGAALAEYIRGAEESRLYSRDLEQKVTR